MAAGAHIDDVDHSAAFDQDRSLGEVDGWADVQGDQVELRAARGAFVGRDSQG
jgi:hypothetical protein